MGIMVNRVIVLSALVLAVRTPSVSASEFLRSRTYGELQQVTREIVEGTLLSELAMDTAHLRKFEDEFRTMYVALPKNEHGTLEPSAVRYALHRYFVQKHGWYVKGLEPAGQGWNSSEPGSVMKSRVPEYIQSLFEKRLNGQGMGLHDLAVFAATLSDFVHNDVASDVVDLYAAFDLPTTMPVRSRDVDTVIKAYVLQLLDSNETITSKHMLREIEASVSQEFPAWGDFKLWVNDVRETMSFERSRRSLKVSEFTLEAVVEEVQEFNDRLGAFQDIECRNIKAGLLDIEHESTGRALLSDFYEVGLRGDHLFIEHIDYLRKLGALDERDPQHPSVIITNYLAGQANCLTSTNFHSVCCFDECQGLMTHLEHAVAAPGATPVRIAELVANLQSDTVDAPRKLSASLRSRLDGIAHHHKGLVPLHGRLFAQWMHHAYPLECPYPHVAGTISPLTPAEWMDDLGADELAASEEERKGFIKEDGSPQAQARELPWVSAEELVVIHISGKAPKRGSLARKLAAFAAVMSLALLIAKVVSAGFTRPSTKCEHMV